MGGNVSEQILNPENKTTQSDDEISSLSASLSPVPGDNAHSESVEGSNDISPSNAEAIRSSLADAVKENSNPAQSGEPGASTAPSEASPSAGTAPNGGEIELQTIKSSESNSASGGGNAAPSPLKLLDPEAFRKATAVNMARRGKFLSQIDDALKSYNEFMKEQNESKNKAPSGQDTNSNQNETTEISIKMKGMKKLDTIVGACDRWLEEHQNPVLPNIKKRKPAVISVRADANLEIFRIGEEINKRKGGGIENPQRSSEDLSTTFNGKGLIPYNEFKRRVDDISIASIIPVSYIMRKRRESFGGDTHLNRLLEAYVSYEATSESSHKDRRILGMDSAKRVSEERYQKLENLKQACDNWLSAHQFKSGILYTITSFASTPASARRDIIAPLVVKGGPIDHEKQMIKTGYEQMANAAKETSTGGSVTEAANFEGISAQKHPDIYSSEEWLKLTNAGITAKRGDHISRIDGLIKEYHFYKEGSERAKKPSNSDYIARDQEKMLDALKQLYTATTFWINLHKEDTGSTARYRYPFVVELSDIVERKLQGNKVSQPELDELNAGKSFRSVLGYLGIGRNDKDLPTVEEFKKLTNLGKYHVRDKVLKKIDAHLEKYHAPDSDYRKEAILQIKNLATYWCLANQKFSEDKATKDAFAAVNNLREQSEDLYSPKAAPITGSAESAADKPKEQEASGIPRILPTVDEFQKITYAGKTATRGANLTRIDKALMKYDVYRVKSRLNEEEQRGAVDALKGLMDACRIWSQVHYDESDGGSIGFRKIFIDKMTTQDGLIAEEVKLLLANKVLTQNEGLNDRVFGTASDNDQIGNVFSFIGSKMTGKFGNEKAHGKVTAYVSLNAPFVPMTSVTASISFEYNDQTTAKPDDYDKPLDEDNVRSTFFSESKISLGVGAKLLFFAQAKANFSYGFLAKAKAGTIQDCLKLVEFSDYSYSRRSVLIPRWLTNLLFGGSVSQKGYESAEAKQPDAIKILGTDDRNYVEKGKSIGGDAKADVKFLASAQASRETQGYKKRITRKAIMEALKQETGQDVATDVAPEDLASKYDEAIKNKQGSKNAARDFHRVIASKREDVAASTISRAETSLVKKGKAAWEWKDGSLRYFRLTRDFEIDKYLAGESASNTVMKMIQTIHDNFGNKNENKFDIMELDLPSSKSSLEKYIDGYEPLQKLRSMKKILKFILGISVNLTLEVNVAKNMLNLYISRIDLDSGILAALPNMLSSQAIIKAKDGEKLLGGLVKSVATVDAGVDIEFSATADDLLGYCQLKSSTFHVNKPAKPKKSTTAKAPASTVAATNAVTSNEPASNEPASNSSIA